MTVIVSGGKARPLAQADTSPADWRAERIGGRGYVPLLTGDGAALTYEGMVRTQPVLFSVVNKLHRGIARLPLHTFQELDDEGNRERVRGHELTRLLRRPWPRGTSWELKARLAGDLLVHANALAVKIRPGPGRPPSELWAVPWRHVTIVKDGSKIDAYKVTIGMRQWTFPPRDVIHMQTLDGVSPIEPLRRTLALEDAAVTSSAETFRNGVTMRGAFMAKEKIRNKEDLERLRSELEKLYGGANNSGRFGLFDSGLEWVQLQQSAVDVELIAQRKLSREEVCSAFDVAPPLIGILERATFNNISELHKAFYVDTLGPWLTMIEEMLQAQLIDDEPSWDGLFVEWQLNELLRPDPESRFRAYLMSQQSSTTTIDERRKAEGLPALAIAGVTDTVLIPVNMIAAGQTVEPGELEMRARIAEAGGGLIPASALTGDSGGTMPPDDPDDDGEG